MLQVAKQTSGKYVNHSVREWLNLPHYHSIALLLLEAEFSLRHGADLTGLTLTIGDCRKTISLELDCNTEEDKQNSLHKLNVLSEAIGLAKRYLLEPEAML